MSVKILSIAPNCLMWARASNWLVLSKRRLFLAWATVNSLVPLLVLSCHLNGV